MRNRPAVDARPEARAAIEAVLERFGPGALRVATNAGVRLIHLRGSEAYRDRSRVLRRLASGVDDWPVPPAGLFVVEERTVYLRSTSPMTVAHEFAHALDCALGGGVYLSGVDPRIRRAFRETRAFITPYAASAPDEYFGFTWNMSNEVASNVVSLSEHVVRRQSAVAYGRRESVRPAMSLSRLSVAA